MLKQCVFLVTVLLFISARAAELDYEIAELNTTLSRIAAGAHQSEVKQPPHRNASAPNAPGHGKRGGNESGVSPAVRKLSRGSGAARRECAPRGEADPCTYVRETEACRLGRVHYLELYYCSVVDKGYPTVLSVPPLLLWMGLVFGALAVSADAYFAPSVANAAAWLRLSDDVAGATLLAFGNGAPDFFTQVAALAGGETVDMPLALGEGVGAGLYVCVFCLGCALLVGPRAGVLVPPRAFVRDAGTYLAGLALILFSARDGLVTGLESGALLLFYALYVAVVVLGGSAASEPRGKELAELSPAESGGEGVGEKAKLEDKEDGGEEEEELPLLGWRAQARAWLSKYSGGGEAETPRWQRAALAPMRLALGLTMADPEKGTVSPLHMVLIVAFLPSFFLFVIGRSPFHAPTTALRWLAAGRASAVALTAALAPRRGLAAARSRLVSTIAFLGGLLWMDCCADEVVGIFQALGHVLGLPEAVLGGTIMCWAASVGDLVATLSVVRHGHLAMAITSSFAGPIFQLLCGLGVGMLCITARGAPVAMVMDLELHVMFGFSIIVLAYFCIAVPTWHRCLLNWRFGYGAVASYLVFVVVYSLLGLEHFA